MEKRQVRPFTAIPVAALMLGSGVSASAQTPDTKSLVSLNGICLAQFLGKPLSCGPKAMYAVRTNGQEFVAFATAAGVVFFFGDQVSQPTPTEHVIAINNSRVDLPNKDRLENSRLQGACHITSSSADGSITQVVCDAINLDTQQPQHFQLTGITAVPISH